MNINPMRIFANIRNNYRTKKILALTAGRFGSLLEESRTLTAPSTPISINNKPIKSIQELAAEIASRRLEKDNKTLDLIDIAIRTTNACAVKGRYYYEFDLGRLLPGRWILKQAAPLLESSDPNKALSILREFGARRQYHSPMQMFLGTDCFPDLLKVEALTKNWFGGHVKESLSRGVKIKIDYRFVEKPEDLASAIHKNHLADDGQTFMLFEKAMKFICKFAEHNPYYKNRIILDLGYLLPHELWNKHVDLTGIDEIIDGKNTLKIENFLFDTHALSVILRS